MIKHSLLNKSPFFFPFVDVTSFYYYIHLLLSISLIKMIKEVFVRHMQMKTQIKNMKKLNKNMLLVYEWRLF
jgi:hypothetical protein